MLKDVGNITTMRDIFPSKRPSASVLNLHHIPRSPSLTSLAHSEGDTALYAPTLVQDPSVVDLPSQSDIIIAYVDMSFKFASKIQNTAVSLARPERAKLQSVSFAVNITPLNVIH